MAPRSKKTASDSQSIVIEYLRKTNRPYSVNDISLNLNGIVEKSKVKAALTDLVQNELIKSKTWGKQSVFYIQPSDSSNERSISDINTSIHSLEEELKQLQERYNAQIKACNVLMNSPTNEELPQVIASKISILEKLKSDIEGIDVEAMEQFDDKPLIQLQKELQRFKKIRKTRNSAFKGMWGEILENVPNPNALAVELGLEMS